MASRTYPVYYAVPSGGTVTPIGADNLIDTLQAADDGRYLWLQDPNSCFVVTNINYDSAFPPGALITSMTYGTRHARTFGGSTATVAGNTVLASLPLPTPSSLVTKPEPQAEDWVDGDLVFDSGALPMTVAAFVTDLARYPGDGSFGFNTPLPDTLSSLWMDLFELTIDTELTLPTVAAPTAFDVRRNRFSMNSTLTGAGLTNATYPWTVWFEYTSADPTASAYDADAVNARFWTTDKQSVYNPDPTSTETLVTGVTASDLLPNMTYSVRVVVENQDGEQVKSDWTSVTTLKFDLARSR